MERLKVLLVLALAWALPPCMFWLAGVSMGMQEVAQTALVGSFAGSLQGWSCGGWKWGIGGVAVAVLTAGVDVLPALAAHANVF